MFDKIREILFRNGAEKVRRAADIEYTRECVLRKFPLLGVAMANLETVPATRLGGEDLETAATDGRHVFYNPDFFDSLPQEQRTFLYAHEVMHVAFNHILRSKGRNHTIWNQATDAVINQILKSENLPMVAGGVDIAEAINKSAEEMYEKLLREHQEKQQQKQNGNGGDGDGDRDNESNDNAQAGHDSHKIWDDVVKRHERESAQESSDPQQGQPQQSQQNQPQGQPQTDADSRQSTGQSQNADAENDNPQKTSQSNGDDGRDFKNWSPETDGKYEPGFEEKNRQMRDDMAAQIQRQLKDAKDRAMAAAVDDSMRSFGDVGRADAVMDWRRVLKKTLQSEHDRWSYRRSDADNDYMARVEEMEEDDRGETEVLLDVSGSVSDEFLREFLRQLRPLLKDSKLRVGCFSHCFYPFVEIKNDRDINNFRIPPRGNTDWDLAVKSFSRGRHINKIVFTDGEAPGRMPDASTRNVNVIWLVYGAEEFNPVCGRVIRVKGAQMQHNFYQTRGNQK